jgi:hypothetical protein
MNPDFLSSWQIYLTHSESACYDISWTTAHWQARFSCECHEFAEEFEPPNVGCYGVSGVFAYALRENRLASATPTEA